MLLQPGTKILSGVHAPHGCTAPEYQYEEFRAMLIKPSGLKEEHTMYKCNQCGAIVMRGDKARKIELKFPNYEFVHLAKPTKKVKKPTKTQIRNARKLNSGTDAPKKKGLYDTPDYVMKGELPPHMQKNASRPYQGGRVSPK